MLTPEYLDSLPDPVLELFRQVEEDILTDMARRISKMGAVTETADWQRWRLEQIQLTRSDITAQLSKLTGLTRQELSRLFEEAATQAIQADDEIYRTAGLSPGSPNDNPELLQLLNGGMQQTSGTFQNLTRTTANTATQQFERALDRAWLQVSSGAFDYQTAIRRAVKALAASGLQAITYPSGHADTLEVAVRRAVLTGVGKTTGEICLSHAEEMGCDLMEITAHPGARPSHMEWQGKIVSLSGQKGYLSKSDIGYGTGDGFKGWNCRHDWFPYFEGLSESAYPREKLREYENQTVTYNGKTLSYYDATQQQRYIERQIRRWKREYRMMDAAGQDTTQASMKLAQWRATERDFCKQTGMPRDRFRSQVEGFGRSEAARAIAQEKNLAKAQNIGYNKNKSEAKQSELGSFKTKLQSDLRIDKNYYSIVKNRFSHGSEIAKRAFNKFVPPDSVADAEYLGRPHYDPNTKKIYMSYLADSQNERGNGVTWYHEHGHLIDDAAGGISNDQTFLDLLTEDRLAYTRTYGKKHHLGTFDKVDQAISRDLSSMREQSGVSDILQAVTKGNVSGVAGHELAYWHDKRNITGEAFAHMFEAQFDAVRYREMKKYFPKSLEYFEKILQEAVV